MSTIDGPCNEGWHENFISELSPNSPVGKPKDRNERGETALHICAKKGDLDGAKKLLDQGTDPNATDFAGKLNSLSEPVTSLYKSWILLGWTALHETCNHGHYHLAQLLIKHGANVNKTGLDDVTALHDAASYGNQKLVKLLLDKGADPFFKNKKGKTPQDIAHPSLGHFFSSYISGKFSLTQSSTKISQHQVDDDNVTLKSIWRSIWLGACHSTDLCVKRRVEMITRNKSNSL